MTADRPGATENDGGVAHRAANWLLLEGSRLNIAGGIVLLSLLALVALLVRYGTAPLRPSSPIYFLFSSLLTGDLTLITVVLSINQLVLSRELGAPGTLEKRIDETLQYRSDVERVSDTGVSPKTPADFLQYLHENVGRQARHLDATIGRLEDRAVRRRMESLVGSLLRDVETVTETLEQGSNQVFAVVSVTLSTNHSTQLTEIARIRDEYASAITDEQTETLDRIESQLLQIDVARRYFKTVYIQKELAFLSRILLYIGTPAVVASGTALVLYNAARTAVIPTYLLTGGATVAFTTGVAPLAILFAFVLRLAWVAQKSATVAPFSTESTYPQ